MIGLKAKKGPSGARQVPARPALSRARLTAHRETVEGVGQLIHQALKPAPEGFDNPSDADGSPK